MILSSLYQALRALTELEVDYGCQNPASTCCNRQTCSVQRYWMEAKRSAMMPGTTPTSRAEAALVEDDVALLPVFELVALGMLDVEDCWN